MKTFKKKQPFLLIVILIFSLILTFLFPTSGFAAAKDTVEKPHTSKSFQSSATMENDYCKATVKGKKMIIEFKTMLPAVQFRIALYGVVPKRCFTNLDTFTAAQNVDQTASGQPIYGFTQTIDFSKKKIKDGQYFLYISRIQDENDVYERHPNNGGLYRNLVFNLTKGTPEIYRYDDIMVENQRIKDIGASYQTDWYLDETLSDIRFTLKIPSTNVYKEMTPYKIHFMREMSDLITADAISDYDKLLKIYEYVAGEFYYDTIAYITHSFQYANPYDNLYNHVNKIPSANSDNQGRVATTCQGYAAIFLSLARAQGIPTRFVFGHRASSPLNNWETEQNIGKKDHWWVESYVDGRWIFIDPTIGTSNKYNKNTGEWQYYGLCSYTFFDPSDEQVAVSHIYHNIYPEKRFGYLITDQYEISKLAAFLNAKTGNLSNGKIMNSNYTQWDKTTWGDGFKANFMTNAYGKTSQIQWSNKGFQGSADFSGFKELKLFSMHHNKLEHVDLSNCPNLETIRLYNNNLKSISLENTKQLKTANITTDNRLKDARLYANHKNIHIYAGNNGAFQLKYDAKNTKKLEVIFKADIGYKASGIYNGGGKKLTSNSSGYCTNPDFHNYEIRFELNPNSYCYYLYEGRNDAIYFSYIQAVQKRLKELDYYNGSIDGIYSAALTEAVENFQHVNGITTTGKIGINTWRVLFNISAKKMPTDKIMEQIKAIHNQHIIGEIAQVKGKKDKVVLTWQLKKPINIKPDSYQIWKSTKFDSGYRKLGSTEKCRFINASNLKKGYRYYYKIRGLKDINGKDYHTQWEYLDIKILSKISKPATPSNPDGEKV